MNFSVLMSVYAGNNSNEFSAALESIYNQSKRPSQIVLVIDGPISNDVEEVIKKYQGCLPIDLVVLKKNSGLPFALNAGVSIVKHDWVMRFDADDINVQNRFEKQMDFIKKHDVDILGGQIEEFDEKNNSHLRMVPLKTADIRKRLPKRNPFNHVTIAIKTSLLQQFPYRNIKYFEDYDLWFRLLGNRDLTAINMEETLVKVRAGEGMMKRRSGLLYAILEFRFRKETYVYAPSKLTHVAFGLIRCCTCIIPSSLRTFIYHKFLRRTL